MSGPGSILAWGFSRDSYPTVWFATSRWFPQIALGHLGLVLTLSNAARASLPSPHLLVVDTGDCAASPLGVALGT